MTDWLTFLVVIVPQIIFLFGALIMAEVDHKRRPSRNRRHTR